MWQYSIADQFLKSQFIRGIKSSYIREKIPSDPSLKTFDNTVTLALYLEASMSKKLEVV